MTWRGGFIRQWPILLPQGLEMVGKKYGLHLNVEAMIEKNYYLTIGMKKE